MTGDTLTEISVLRFTVAGSVDDGKSTLIGRLLYDTNSILEDQLKILADSSTKRGLSHLDFAGITDGLKEEREQGITIDVAYRYFSTENRKFILSDTPGHLQYTRNMVTGASMANLALILVDARKGILEQTRRHSYIASLLRISHLVVCVNKMDLVGYDQEPFREVVHAYEELASRLEVKDIRFIPISALHGDNVVYRSEKMAWYEGSTLLHTLENVHVGSEENLRDARFPVQIVIRPQGTEFPDFRGYAGRIAGGIFREGDEILVEPGEFRSRIRQIWLGDRRVPEAYPPMSVTLTLEDDIAIGRGDLISKPGNKIELTCDLEVMMCWFNKKPLNLSQRYILKHTTTEMQCVFRAIRYQVDINTLEKEESGKEIGMNAIFCATLQTGKPIPADAYRSNRHTGSLILIDAMTNETVAAGMIL